MVVTLDNSAKPVCRDGVSCASPDVGSRSFVWQWCQATRRAIQPAWLCALYLSLDPTTAWMEAQQGFPFKPQPMTLVAYKIECAKIADLNDEQLLANLGSSPQELGCAWEDLALQHQVLPIWRLAEQLRTLEVAGVPVRSFAFGCTSKNQNLVLWDWSDAEPNAVRVIDDFGRLPKTPESWNVR